MVRPRREFTEPHLKGKYTNEASRAVWKETQAIKDFRRGWLFTKPIKVPEAGLLSKAVMDTTKGGLFKAMTLGGRRLPLGRGIAAFLLVGGLGAAAGMIKTTMWRPMDRPSGLRYGPGYIGWSKREGLPHNNLSTDNLVQSLHGMRHASIF